MRVRCFFPLALTLLPLFFILPVLVPQGIVFVVIDDCLVGSRAAGTELVLGLHLLAFLLTFLVYVVLAYWFLWRGMYQSLEFNHCLRDV